jgi:fatty acid desaturase
MNPPRDAELDARATQDDEQANLGAYFLTVGLVSISFGAVFSLVFSGIVALLLLAVVVGVAIISVAAGLYTDTDLLFPKP